MKQYRVLFYTGGFTHTLYRELYACAPKEIQFIASSAELKSIEIKEDIIKGKKWSYNLITEFKKLLLDTIATAHVPVVKARNIQAQGVDLIHSGQYLLLNDLPWVVDFEDITTFVWYRRKILQTRWARQNIRKLLGSPYCRKILPWTDAARQSLLNSIDDDGVDKKLQVVYPCIRVRTRQEKTRTEGVEILFIGTNFYQKGGMETLLAFEELSNGYPVHLTMVSYVPAEIRHRYRAWKNVTFKACISVNQLEEEYRKADVFVLPVHTDTFGFVFLEAFARGIPCISTRHFAVPEIISEGQTGLVIDSYESYFDERYLPRYPLPVLSENHAMIRALRRPPKAYISHLARAIERLIVDRSLREQMGEAAYREVLTGRFSCERRRQAMSEVYREALEA